MRRKAIINTKYCNESNNVMGHISLVHDAEFNKSKMLQMAGIRWSSLYTMDAVLSYSVKLEGTATLFTISICFDH